MLTGSPEHLSSEVKVLLAGVVAWAESVPDLNAIALVGSQARGVASSVSDVDLILFSSDPEHLHKQRDWISLFGIPDQIEDEDWGKVTALRVFYSNGLEVEFGVTGLAWGADPSDLGDAQVIRDGLLVLYEAESYLSNILKQFELHPE